MTHKLASYVSYNSPGAVDTQDQNTFRTPPSQFPKNFYKKEPYNPSHCFPFGTCGRPESRPETSPPSSCQPYNRDVSIDYFFPTEVEQHPGHFSRFGYPWCHNGYCVGNFPGRYNTPHAMRWQTGAMPANMAPPKFYAPEYTETNVFAETYNASFRARQLMAQGRI